MLTRVTAGIQQLCSMQCEAQVHSVHTERTCGRVSGQVRHRALQLQAEQLHHGVQQRLLACSGRVCNSFQFNSASNQCSSAVEVLVYSSSA